MRHTATIAAYPVKDELGGGFRGVMLIRATKERKASDCFDTFEEAVHWAKSAAHAVYGTDGYKLAPVRRKGEYQANVWVA